MDISNNFEKLAVAIVYAILVSVSFVLVQGIYTEYLEDKTDFYLSKQSLAVEDNPALLISIAARDCNMCDIRFGDDYSVNLLHWNETHQEYLRNPNQVIHYHDRTQGNHT